MTSLNPDFAILSNWFYKSITTLNPNKCSFVLLGVKNELQTDLTFNNVTIKNSKEKKVLKITIDNKLDVSPHLTSIDKKANIELNALTRVQNI